MVAAIRFGLGQLQKQPRETVVFDPVAPQTGAVPQRTADEGLTGPAWTGEQKIS